MIDNRLNLEQSNQLTQTLSPQQIRYFRLLEMNELQLEEEVRKQIDENPALEAVEPEHEIIPEEDSFNESAQELQAADYRDEDEMPMSRQSLGSQSESGYDIYERATRGQSLYDQLRDQVTVANLSDNERLIAEFIIGNIDENGYLSRSTADIADDIAESAGLMVSSAQVRQVASVIRGFDPAGVCAFDLRDCLLLQIDRKDPSTPYLSEAREIIDRFFDLFSHKHYSRLAAAMGVEEDTLREALSLIVSLNPKPADGSEQSANDLIVPDFEIDIDDNVLSLKMPSRVPELSIESTFEINDAVTSNSDKRHKAALKFLRLQRNEAAGFIEIVSLRRKTLFRVMNAIMSFQREFFLTGEDRRIKPLTLRDISNVTGDDISVVSRATSGKYVFTPWGTFPLRHFFSERFPGGGEDTEGREKSQREVMEKLRSLIESEDHRNPMTDRMLADEMAKAGYDVARRTIAKYREMMGFPVGRLRKQL